MKLCIHDFTGHVGQTEVARALARRGHNVVFLYSSDLPTPRGGLFNDEHDVPLSIEPISIGQRFNKKNHFKRQFQDCRYAFALVRHLKGHRPDVVISANNPLIPQWWLLRYCRKQGIPVVHWWTDVYSLAVRHGVGRRYGPMGRVVACFYEKLEAHLLKGCQEIIAITSGFEQVASAWCVETPLTVISVAAPTEQVKPASKANPWSERQQLTATKNVLYVGTLGIKHHPEVLLRFAQALRDRPDIRVIVASEGGGADWLLEQQANLQLPNLVLLPYQSFEDYPHVLATGDVHLTVLNEDASGYSLPSKVMSQFCAERPQVAVVPEDNWVAKMIREADAGRVFSLESFDDAKAAVLEILADEALADRYGRSARRYAEEFLSVEALIPDYEQVLARVVPTARRAYGANSQPAGHGVAVTEH